MLLAAPSRKRPIARTPSGLAVLRRALIPKRICRSWRKYRAGRSGWRGAGSIPAVYFVRDFVDAGGLMSYGPETLSLYRRTAIQVDKILKGAKPADLPVEEPTKFESVINLKTAKSLGLTIPQTLLLRADQIIE